MHVYRITARQHAHDPLSGQGAAISGARWNSVGTRMGYTAGSPPLAILELLVHLPRDCVPPDRVMLTIEVPDTDIVALTDLPEGCDRLPYSTKVQKAGDAWVRSASSLALRVPSAIVPRESNILVNPLHPRMSALRVLESGPLVWDARLFDLGE